MKSFTEHITYNVPSRRGFVNITHGTEVVIAITKGELDFGPWEQIFYGEFDGRRPKRVLVKVIGI
jgi:thiamine phosphate synthase YjbQ (UPF0047 family)